VVPWLLLDLVAGSYFMCSALSIVSCIAHIMLHPVFFHCGYTNIPSMLMRKLPSVTLL
jgi:hypothetical protein